MTEVTQYAQLDLGNINYSNPVHKQNVYYGSIRYGELPCYIQTAKMTFMGTRDDKTSKQKYLVVRVDPQDFSLYDCLVKLDDHNLASTYKFSREWFQKDLPMDILETMYRRITKPFKKDDVPELELRIPVIKQRIQCNIYDQSNNSISLDHLSKGTTIIGILHMKGLKFLKKDYYCDIYVSQIKLCQTIQYLIPIECLIVDEDENDMYDYEILDEEVIINNKTRMELNGQIEQLRNKIDNDHTELSILQKKLDNLN